MAVVRPKAPTASNEEPMAQIIGMPVENRRPRTIRNPPPIPKKPDKAPTPTAALATGKGLRVLGFQSWQTLLVATLTSCAHGIDRRFAGAIAVGIGMEHRFQDRLQVASGDLLGDAVSHRRNAQRSRPTIRLWNIDPPHRRRKVAP